MCEFVNYWKSQIWFLKKCLHILPLGSKWSLTCTWILIHIQWWTCLNLVQELFGSGVQLSGRSRWSAGCRPWRRQPDDDLALLVAAHIAGQRPVRLQLAAAEPQLERLISGTFYKKKNMATLQLGQIFNKLTFVTANTCGGFTRNSAPI